MSDSTNINHLFILLLLATFFALPVFSFQSVLTAIGSRQTLFMSLDSACNERTKQTFSGTTILLTGASGGLGRSLSLQLAHCKAHALVLSGRNEEALKAVESECKALYPEIITHIITCDLSDQESVMNLANSALLVCNGRIDVLVNNGGVSSRSRFLDTKIDVDQKIMQINFFAGAALAKALVPGMVERGFGKVVWISSVQGLFGIPNRTSYAASKFAVQGYCEAMRAELASSGVAVHVASPGYIRTNLSKSALTGDGGLYAKLDEATASGADPNDVAIDVLQKSAVGKADFITAATLSAKAAIWLKFFAPGLLNRQLVKRYEKSQEAR